jgi:hypothetical protein
LFGILPVIDADLVPGFKKNVNRATTQVMMKTGHVEKTNDRDYEVEERYGSPGSRRGPQLTIPQTIQNNGSRLDAIAEGSKRILGFFKRCVWIYSVPRVCD